MGDFSDITVETIGPYLAQHLPEIGALQAIEKFSDGQSNPTYKLTCGNGVYVLRSKPPGILLKSAHQVEREYRVMAALADTPVPVPHMLHLVTDKTSPIGRAFFVMGYLEGRIFFDPALPDCRTAERSAIYLAMARTLAKLHEVDPAAVGLADYGRPGNYFQRQTERWTGQYAASRVTQNAAMDALSTWLLDNIPADDGQATLVHGDYRLDNMIFASDRAEVLAVLDWELSTLGHPFADLAYQCMQWQLPNQGGMRGLAGVDRVALGIPTEDTYIDLYCAERGIARPDGWPFYLAFSYFRLAAILEGVVRRAHDGNASNPQTAKAYAAAIPILAGQAMALINA
ncbi:phosphotransferase [Litoreibacter roseus]|uniref:Aminoglycoside phosphotransferase n=1 Tax=Litoreibacter roseus TaxID=2601869 RepID=A0A6N6JBV6_9RHOB|nr:phosphotransferase [Litoreibacter roseus]GFE63655.1 aminoglycoside phosphotransferase [Litoreibacter roseus]